MTLTESNDFDIRYTSPTDSTLLRLWLEESSMRHWYPPSTEQELDNFLRVWMGYSQYKAGLTALFKQQPIAMGVLYLMPYKKIAHQAMFQLIVSTAYQRQGVGRALVRNLLHLAKNRFRLELVHVEILDQSGLIPLLESLDFHTFGVQSHYVKEGQNYYSRFLMEKEL